MQAFAKKPKDPVKTEQNEMRITAKGSMRKYIGYATKLLSEPDFKEMHIMATGNAIAKSVILVEMIKRRHGNF